MTFSKPIEKRWECQYFEHCHERSTRFLEAGDHCASRWRSLRFAMRCGKHWEQSGEEGVQDVRDFERRDLRIYRRWQHGTQAGGIGAVAHGPTASVPISETTSASSGDRKRPIRNDLLWRTDCRILPHPTHTPARSSERYGPTERWYTRGSCHELCRFSFCSHWRSCG